MKIPLRSYWSLLQAYLWPLRQKVLLLSLLLAGGIGLQLYVPRMLQRFIDAGLGGAASGALLGQALLFLGLALLLQLLQVGATFISRDVAWRATNQLRTDLTLHTLGLDLESHKSRTPGETRPARSSTCWPHRESFGRSGRAPDHREPFASPLRLSLS